MEPDLQYYEGDDADFQAWVQEMELAQQWAEEQEKLNYE